jgi:hypothetical protein
MPRNSPCTAPSGVGVGGIGSRASTRCSTTAAIRCRARTSSVLTCQQSRRSIRAASASGKPVVAFASGGRKVPAIAGACAVGSRLREDVSRHPQAPAVALTSPLAVPLRNRRHSGTGRWRATFAAKSPPVWPFPGPGFLAPDIKSLRCSQEPERCRSRRYREGRPRGHFLGRQCESSQLGRPNDFVSFACR